VHLTGKTDARHVIARCLRLLQRFFHRRAASTPPIEGVLFGPAILRRREGLMFVRAGCGNAAAPVDEKRACAAGSNINA
jgi:hypothetical protein